METLQQAQECAGMFGYNEADAFKLWFGGCNDDDGYVVACLRKTGVGGNEYFTAAAYADPRDVNRWTQLIAMANGNASGEVFYYRTSLFDRSAIEDRKAKGETVAGSKQELKSIVGCAMDVDAGKSDTYADASQVWEAIQRMPTPPSMVIQSGDDDGGFHVYWKFDRPIRILNLDQIDHANAVFRAWRGLLVDKLAAVLDEQGVHGYEREKLVDRTYGAERVLRPVGAMRKCGLPVRVVDLDPSRRYTLADVTPEGFDALQSTRGGDATRAGGTVFDDYFAQRAADGDPITVDSLLAGNGFSPMGGGKWIRDGASSKSRSLIEGDEIDGLPGVNVFSGNCEPLKCGDDKNEVGRRYNLYQLWVALEFGDADDPANWKLAANFCRGELKQDAAEVFDVVESDFKPVDALPAAAAADPVRPSIVPRIVNSQEFGGKNEARTLVDIVSQIDRAGSGWPKSVAGTLFVVQNDEPRTLKKANALIGWFHSIATVEFGTDKGCLTKPELFEELPHHVERYDAVEKIPHFPPRAGVYYSCESPPPGDGSHLEALLDFFHPAGPIDRELMRALIVTTLWGGPCGARPFFAVDAPTVKNSDGTGGTGAGKSTLAKKVGDLSGGAFTFDQSTTDEVIRKSIINDVAGGHRIVLLDNLKSVRFASSAIESMITAEDVGGWENYSGYRNRPNTFTWIATMNGLKMSRDMAHRTVSIFVTKPKYSGDWDARVNAYIEANRYAIFGDCRAILERPATELNVYGRWGTWEREVLSKMNDPNALQREIITRAKRADSDRDTGECLTGYVEDKLEAIGYRAGDVVHMTTTRLVEWIHRSCGRDMRDREVSPLLEALSAGGSLTGFAVNRCRKHGRGWTYTLPGADLDLPTSYDLEQRLSRHVFE